MSTLAVVLCIVANGLQGADQDCLLNTCKGFPGRCSGSPHTLEWSLEERKGWGD